MITPGYLGRICESMEELVKEVKALRAEKEQSSQEVERCSLDKFTESDWELVAYHESGHAIVAHVLCKNSTMEKVTMQEKNNDIVGYCSKTYENVYIKKSEFLDMQAAKLAGMVAEDAIYGEHSAGCERDLQEAKEEISYMLKDWGMGKKLSYGDANVEAFENEMEEILQQQKARAEKVINENIDVLKALQKELLHHRELTGDQIYEFFKKHGI